MVNGRAARQERGQILILTALSMTVLLGIAALSIDASFMYNKRNKLYAAADAAAKIGAAEVHRQPGVGIEVLKTIANYQLTLNGLTPAACGSAEPGTTSLCVNHPPSSGPFMNNADYVEAIVSEVSTTFFANILGVHRLTPRARAVAGTSSGPSCLVTLGVGSPGIRVSNAIGSITADACAILDGGNLTNSGTITAQAIGVTGTCTGGCGGVALNMPSPLDPLEALPIVPAECVGAALGPDLTVVGAVLLSPDTYHNITFGGGTLTLQPGTYCITGQVTASPGSAVVWNDTGGVTIYLARTARMNLTSTDVTITLEAQTSGVYHGILFYQDRRSTTAALLSSGGGTITVNGVLYFPVAPLQMTNATFAMSDFCGLIVARSVDLAKSTMALANKCASFGGSPILTFSMAE